MKTSQIGNVLLVVALLLAAAYIYSEGRAMGRAGFTSLSRESHPVVFWIEVVAFALLGALLLAHSLAKTLNVANGLTDRVDLLIERLNFSRGVTHGPKDKGK
jgi:hypothetical protein